MPRDWGASLAEWQWYCYRTRHSRGEARPEDHAPAPAVVRPATPSGATAGWRSGKW